MSDTRQPVPTGSPSASHAQARWIRILHWTAHHASHPIAHASANSVSILMGFLLGIWIAYAFWFSSQAPSWAFVAWVIGVYCVVEPVTGALCVFRKDRWVAPTFDIMVSVLLFVEIALASIVGGISAHPQLSLFLLLMLFGSLAGGIVISMIVNTRTIGGSPIPITA